MPTVVCVANMKGGVGKTTLSVNLAFELLILKKKVLLVDNDPQFNATSALCTPDAYVNQFLSAEAPFHTIHDIYERQPRLSSSVSQKGKSAKAFFLTRWVLRGTNYSLDLLASRIELYDTLRNPSHKEYLLDKFLKTHAAAYDFVLIDCPPTPSVLTLSAFAASDFVIIPASPDYFATFGLAQFLGTLLDFKSDLHDEHDIKPLGLVFTRVPRKPTPDIRRAMQEVVRTLSDLKERDGIDVPIFDAHLSHFGVYEKALWRSVPVKQITGRGTRGREQSSHEIECLALEFIKRANSAVKARKK